MVNTRFEARELEKQFADRYRVRWVESQAEGCAGYELWFDQDGKELCACRIIYWDAVGQYFVELPNGEVRASYVLRLLKEVAKRVNVPLEDLG